MYLRQKNGKHQISLDTNRHRHSKPKGNRWILSRISLAPTVKRSIPREIQTISVDLHKHISTKRSRTTGNKNLNLLTSPIYLWYQTHHVSLLLQLHTTSGHPDHDTWPLQAPQCISLQWPVVPAQTRSEKNFRSLDHWNIEKDVKGS